MHEVICLLRLLLAFLKTPFAIRFYFSLQSHMAVRGVAMGSIWRCDNDVGQNL
jgi:hypothetical protein